jgi:hypothetical protein
VWNKVGSIAMDKNGYPAKSRKHEPRGDAGGWGTGGVWAVVKKVFVVLSLASIGLNVWTLQRIRCKFIADLEEINHLRQESA